MKKVFVIAEAGVNHNGSLDLALRLCSQAKKSGADAVKFQTFKTEKIVSKNARLANYQKKNINENVSFFDMVKKLELSYASFAKIKKYCDNIGIQFLSTPDEEESLEFLMKLGMRKIKIGSGCITDLPFLEKVAGKHKEVILSTGMSYLGEVKKAYSVLLANGAKRVSLLHCTTSYPCPVGEVNLRVIPRLKKVFNTEIGYSDHTQGIEVAIAAVALGAEIIEKHLTLDKNMPGPDHKASINPRELKKMIEGIRKIEKALGTDAKEPTAKELENRELGRRSIVAARNIKKGEVFTEENLAVKIAGCGLSPLIWKRTIGRKAKEDFKEDDLIRI